MVWGQKGIDKEIYMAVISLALKEYLEDVHDVESGIITIKPKQTRWNAPKFNNVSEERKVKNSTALHFIKFKIQNSKDMKYQYTVKGVDYEVEIQDIEGNIANVTVNGIPFEVEMKQPVKAGKQKKLGGIANEGASSSSSAPQSAKASADLQSAASS